MSKVYLEIGDVEKLEAAAGFWRDKLLVRLLFRLGCRVSEALAIEVKDIDFIKGTVTIQHLKSRTKLTCPKCSARLSKSHTYCPGYGSKVEEIIAKGQEYQRMRTLPLDKDTRKMLKDYIRLGGPVKQEEQTLLFGISRHRAWQIIKACAEKARLPKLTNPETGKVHNVSPHKLRDAFATHAVKLNVSGDGLRLLQEHLGHASFNTTAKYRKVAGEEHKNWYDKLWKPEGKA